MKAVGESQMGIWLSEPSDAMRKALRRVQDEIRNAGSDILDW
jgi:hypothetical protein